ncbi:hypothetical protein P8452_37705 [Trifolium repens]|jgi:hypothetical protein|nr:hypothetical protein P8452_37705 [Trifolium repens]
MQNQSKVEIEPNHRHEKAATMATRYTPATTIDRRAANWTKSPDLTEPTTKDRKAATTAPGTSLRNRKPRE